MRRRTLLLAAVLLAGCAATRQMYSGPRRAPAEVGILRSGVVSQGLSSNAFYIRSVDDQAALAFTDAWRGYPELELLPGPHTIAVGLKGTGVFTDTYSLVDCVISLDVAAGHTYVVEGNLRQTNWHAWTRDVATNQITHCSFPGLPRADGTDAAGWTPPCPYGQERVVAIPDIAALTFENFAAVRLAGLAPESGAPDGNHDPFSILGQCVRVQGQRGTTRRNSLDPGARAGSYVYLGDNSFLNLLLIEGGYAAVDRDASHRYLAEFEAAERAARAHGRGRWASPAAAAP